VSATPLPADPRAADPQVETVSRRPWTLRWTEDGETLIATFRGRLSGRDGAASAAAFATELSRGPARVIWNLTEMTGYEAGARVAWQRALWPVRHHIRSIEVVGGGPIVRVGAVTLTMALGLAATFVEAGRSPAGRSSAFPRDRAAPRSPGRAAA
jgi:hypothetical protein